MINPNEFKKAFQAWIEKTTTKKDNILAIEDQKFIQELMGYPGTMLSGSKRAPETKGKGEHLCVWNANLIVEGYNKIWFGDINLTRDEEKIKKIALHLKAKLYVLREMDARFSNENNPQIQNAVYVTDGVTSTLGKECSSYYERDGKGKLYRK
jgi:hypothetical protein